MVSLDVVLAAAAMTLSLSQGDVARVQLEEPIASGFEWRVVASNDQVATVRRLETQVPPALTNNDQGQPVMRLGGTALVFYEINAIGIGCSKFDFFLSRSWVRNDHDEHRTLNVMVK